MPIPIVNELKPSQYFLDASFLIALIDSDDNHHTKACALFERILASPHEIYLSDVLLNEVYTVFGKRCERSNRGDDYEKLTKKIASFVVDRPVLCLYELFNQSYGKVVSLMKSSKGRLSLHDGLIVLFLQQVHEVFLVTFDEDFKKISGLSILS